jgi:hypothetical protein
MKPSIAAHQALSAVGLHGLALAGYPPRRWAAGLMLQTITNVERRDRHQSIEK